jgi:hypothetical protein
MNSQARKFIGCYPFHLAAGNVKSLAAALSIDHQRWASLVEQLVEGGLELPRGSDFSYRGVIHK